jgi:hypothetical protein
MRLVEISRYKEKMYLLPEKKTKRNKIVNIVFNIRKIQIFPAGDQRKYRKPASKRFMQFRPAPSVTRGELIALAGNLIWSWPQS